MRCYIRVSLYSVVVRLLGRNACTYGRIYLARRFYFRGIGDTTSYSRGPGYIQHVRIRWWISRVALNQLTESGRPFFASTPCRHLCRALSIPYIYITQRCVCTRRSSELDGTWVNARGSPWRTGRTMMRVFGDNRMLIYCNLYYCDKDLKPWLNLWLNITIRHAMIYQNQHHFTFIFKNSLSETINHQVFIV